MSLYLSRLILNPCSRQVMSELAHPYEMHRTLMCAFPRATDATEVRARDEFCVLFRADADDLPRLIKVYVQSRIEPDWSFLHGLNDYLRTNTQVPGYECKDIMPACRKIQNGQVFSFRLRGNPTKRIATKGNALNGKRVGLVREDEQIAWLVRKGREREKGVPGGFEVLTMIFNDEKGQQRLVPRVTVCGEGKRRGRKAEAESGYETTHLAVRFDGLLLVTDASAFLETLTSGIGPAKAFGFGLLSVAPVKEGE